jgi:hypothetical protein
MKLLFLSLLLSLFAIAARADNTETITASNVQIGQDTLNFTATLDA